MSRTIMPSFVDMAGYPRPEGLIVGRLLAGYGDLELCMCYGLLVVEGWDLDGAVKLIFGQRGEKRRIDEADKILQPNYAGVHLGPQMAETIADMHWCREIRNQFAHCHWESWNIQGLKFVDLERVAKLKGKIRKAAQSSRRISLPTLQSQEAYFAYVSDCFEALAHAYQCAVKDVANHGLPRPLKMKRPRKHD
jgi:hypothetical protein